VPLAYSQIIIIYFREELIFIYVFITITSSVPLLLKIVLQLVLGFPSICRHGHTDTVLFRLVWLSIPLLAAFVVYLLVISNFDANARIHRL